MLTEAVCFSLLMFGAVLDNYSSKLKGKQHNQNSSLKHYKTEIKILANPGLASSGFEQPGPDVHTIFRPPCWCPLEVHQYGGSILGSVNLCKIFRQIFEIWEEVKT